MSQVPEIAVFKSTRPLTKKYWLDGDGKLVCDKSSCAMGQGTAFGFSVLNIDAFSGLIDNCPSNVAFVLGALRPDLPRNVYVTTQDRITPATPFNTIFRSRANLVFGKGKPGYVGIDYDRKGAPPELLERINKLGGFVPALISICPGIAGAARLVRASTSAGLFNSATGEQFHGSGGFHCFIAVQDVSDSKRFIEALFDRCWLHGLGWIWISDGALPLLRSIVDRVTPTPEHLFFEGNPILGLNLAQDLTARVPIITDGGWLDTRDACPSLNAAENVQLQKAQNEARHAVAFEVAKAREAFVQRHSLEIAQRTGITPTAARQIAIQYSKQTLLPEVMLEFYDPALKGSAVADVLANPTKFARKTLADPLEGVDYGRQTAMVLIRKNGVVWIRSYAHGGIAYRLQSANSPQTVNLMRRGSRNERPRSRFSVRPKYSRPVGRSR
jgi:hypothetical protein